MNLLQITIRLVLAALLGGLIGLEREKHGRAAGFRTHLLVALGSALTMMVSLYLYDVFKGFHTANYASGVDPSRIASLVIAGIGFIGGGTIIQSRGTIRGLTTAACLWVAAAIGLAVGCGYYVPAIISTIISLISLIILKQIGQIIKKDWYHHIDIEMEDRKDGLEDIKRVLEANDVNILKTNFNKNIPNNEIVYSINIRLQKTLDTNLINSLAQGVTGIKRIISN